VKISEKLESVNRQLVLRSGASAAPAGAGTGLAGSDVQRLSNMAELARPIYSRRAGAS
jgi:hypothetical protein